MIKSNMMRDEQIQQKTEFTGGGKKHICEYKK